MKWRKLRIKRLNEAIEKHQLERIILYSNMSQETKNQILGTYRSLDKFKQYNQIRNLYGVPCL
jgi:hypothetical protein